MRLSLVVVSLCALSTHMTSIASIIVVTIMNINASITMTTITNANDSSAIFV